jgi:hypothetical protein
VLEAAKFPIFKLTFHFEASVLHREVALVENLELYLDMICFKASSVDIIPHHIFTTSQQLSLLQL